MTRGAIAGQVFVIRERGLVPADVAALMAGRKAEPPREVCEPGCGKSIDARGFGTHRRTCDAYQQFRAEHVVEVAPLAGAVAPAPMADALVARKADDAKHHDRARAKADETWRNRHGQA